MSSEFNNLILTPNDIDNINPYIPSETNIYRYNYYIPKATYTQSVINSPIIPKINTNYNKIMVLKLGLKIQNLKRWNHQILLLMILF